MQEKLLIRDYLDENRDSLFLDFCLENNCHYLEEITATDYVLFAIKHKLGHDKYKEVESRINELISKAYLNNWNNLEKKLIDDKTLFNLSSPIELMALSNRARNALANANIDTIYKLYIEPKERLKDIRSLGNKSLEEVLEARNKFFPEAAIIFETINAMGPNFKEYLFLALKDEDISEIEIKCPNQKSLIAYVKGLVVLLGKEIVDRAMEKPKETSSVLEALSDYSCKTLNLKKNYEAYNKIPANRLEMEVSKFIDILYEKEEVAPIIEDLSGIYKVKEIKALFSQTWKDKDKSKAIYCFINFISCDISLFLDSKISNIFRKFDCHLRKEVLYRRYKGETLQKISKDHGVTREWVRQTEKKVKSSVLETLSNIEFDLYAYVALDLGVDIISREGLCDYVGKDQEVDFLCCLIIELYEKSSYVYDDKIDAILLREKKKELEEIKEIVKSLDRIIPKENVRDVIKEKCKEYAFDCDLVEPLFYNKYSLCGNLYIKGKLSLPIIYDYVLKEFYPRGLKAYKEGELEKFKKQVLSLFGKVRLPRNLRVISSKIWDLAYLYDRGIYIHKSYVDVNKELMKEIENYMENRSRLLFSYSELYEAFEGQLKKNKIKNKYLLKSILKDVLEKEYFLSRDYISKKERWTLEEEVEEFIRRRKRVSREDLVKAFCGLNSIVILNCAKNNYNIITREDGDFSHISYFSIEKEDREYLFNLISRQIEKVGLSSKRIFHHIMSNYNMFLIKNRLTSHNELYDILRHTFYKEFEFSRPFISKIKNVKKENRSKIKKLLRTYDKISFVEATEILERESIKDLSFSQLLNHLGDNFIQVSENEIGILDESLIDDYVRESIIERLYSLLLNKSYFPVRKIKDYRDFPNIGYEWNPYLLRSIVNRHLYKEVPVIDGLALEKNKMNAILVDSNYLGLSYSEFLEKVIRKKTFVNSNHVRDWIREEGLDIEM